MQNDTRPRQVVQCRWTAVISEFQVDMSGGITLTHIVGTSECDVGAHL